MSASSGVIVALAIIGIFVGYFIIMSMFAPPAVSVPQATLAGEMADQIRSLPPVDNGVCQGAPSLVANALTILQDMDGTLGTGFGHFAQFDASNCDFVVQFLPILGSYNSLVRDSRTLDANNSTSVKVFYEDLFLLSSDFIMINDSVGYKIAFKSTGELNDALKLDKLREVCGNDCYKVVLSGIHWAIRDYMDQLLCQFESWASQYTQIIPYHPC
jgi:hypothetical protein